MSWSWKVASADDNARLNLRYEPGCWGDVLKGDWALVVARQLPAGFLCVDPFAGAPDYPLLETVGRRLAGLPPGDLFGPAQRPWWERGLLASTASLLAAEGARLEVFDLDPERRSRWPAALPLEDAREALGRPCDLLLWDPYDFFERWAEWIGPLVEAGRTRPVLIYLYNKACRGQSQTRQYESMRKRLGPHLAGRIPSDERLPRAWHEMLLLAPPPFLDQVRGTLTELTCALARQLAEAGAMG